MNRVSMHLSLSPMARAYSTPQSRIDNWRNPRGVPRVDAAGVAGGWWRVWGNGGAPSPKKEIGGAERK